MLTESFNNLEPRNKISVLFVLSETLTSLLMAVFQLGENC